MLRILFAGPPLKFDLRSLALAALLTAGASESPAAQLPSPTLTLDEAVRLALVSNRDLSMANREVERASEAIAAAKTARWPKLNLSAVGLSTVTDLDLRLGPLGALPLPSNFAFGIATATQPISQLHDIGLGIKASQLSKDMATERQRAARQGLVDEIKRAYYGCLRAESGLAVMRQSVSLFKELDRVLEALVAERAALDADRLDVQARLAQQEHELLVLDDALSTGRERINVALGRDPETPFSLEAPPEDLPGEADLAATTDEVLARRPDLNEARIAIDLATVDWKLKKAERYPRVGALFAYVGNAKFPLLPGKIGAAVLQASWEPFDWGRRSREMASKQIVVQQAETRLRQLKATVTVDLRQRMRTLREARSLVGVTDLQMKAARERLRVMLNKRTEEAVLAKDLLQAQVALADADHKHQAALLSYWEGRAEFEKAMAVER